MDIIVEHPRHLSNCGNEGTLARHTTAPSSPVYLEKVVHASRTPHESVCRMGVAAYRRISRSSPPHRRRPSAATCGRFRSGRGTNLVYLLVHEGRSHCGTGACGGTLAICRPPQRHVGRVASASLGPRLPGQRMTPTSVFEPLPQRHEFAGNRRRRAGLG